MSVQLEFFRAIKVQIAKTISEAILVIVRLDI